MFIFDFHVGGALSVGKNGGNVLTDVCVAVCAGSEWGMKERADKFGVADSFFEIGDFEAESMAKGELLICFPLSFVGFSRVGGWIKVVLKEFGLAKVLIATRSLHVARIASACLFDFVNR